MTINTFIVDDEPHAIAVLRRYIDMTPGLALLGFATDSMHALAEIDKNGTDLVFADIDMPILSGIALANLIKPPTQVVFTTSFREYGVEAFEKNALDYLLKPFSYERFLIAVQKFKANHVKTESETGPLFINAGVKGKLIRVIPEELIHIEGAQNFAYLHFAHESLLVYLTLQELLNQLPGKAFVRTHKSHIVNIHKIKVVEGGQLHMENQKIVPIGRTFQETFSRQLQEMTIAKHTSRQ